MLFHASESAAIYSAHFCTNETFYSSDTKFQSNLNTLLSSLVSNSSLPSNSGFLRTSVDDIDGRFLCRGDVNATVCHGCVAAAAANITRLCPNDTESYIWYDECTLIYSNSTFNNDDIVPGIPLNDEGSTVNSNQDHFNQLLLNLLNSLEGKALESSMGEKKFAAGAVSVTSAQTLQTQRVVVVRRAFEAQLQLFHRVATEAEEQGFCFPYVASDTNCIPFCTIPPCSFLLQQNYIDDCDDCYPDSYFGAVLVHRMLLVAKKAKRKALIIYVFQGLNSVPNFATTTTSRYLTEEESLHFDLATIEAATNSFSDEMKIGEGGFGAVYKGIFPNGEEIAVKRLSRTSLQGDREFKNEVLLIAQLQHKNLVRLLGFCMERTERILVYEFIQNSSLDHFLFDHEDHALLDWARRYKIIVGIVRGIQYLHEDSRLKVIHRDLKASNVLLDADMNPKISDFGMAKVFHGDQSQENTRTGRVVGTFGYMSPEYAMHGKFSEKSDVFSFGVLVLEILSGKKNTSYYRSHEDNDDLLSFAWKNWIDRTPFQILDPKLRGSYSRNEVQRCIHVALLCVQENPVERPSMATITLALNAYSVTLGLPRQPASFVRGRVTTERLRHQHDSDQSNSSSIPYSAADSLITEVYPR
ncbi:hypothetical protein V8G54_028501 [Vigna mungo]|uniref:Cysteine-rich receptor-like protein kinase 10 n=1 Tax=Vigna mungo TaxID=3915 RepID=A0AAQ3MSI1_VIGMU